VYICITEKREKQIQVFGTALQQHLPMPIKAKTMPVRYVSLAGRDTA